MDQVRDLADNRLFRGCAYCGGVPGTRDHVPSKIFLDEPFPDELPVVGACSKCNNGFSQDEEYVACLIECAVVGSVVPEHHRREKVAKILRRSSALRSKLESAQIFDNESVSISVEAHRIKNIVLKLARGHAMFELSWYSSQEPESIWWAPILLLDEQQRKAFEDVPPPQLFGEIGARAFQRMYVLQMKVIGADGEERSVDMLFYDWVEVQEGRYRYLATDQDGAVCVRMVIGDYLACEVFWRVC